MAEVTCCVVMPYLASLVRLQPDAHGVVHAAKKRAVAHAVEAFEFVNNVDLGPVVDEHVAIAPVGRIETEHLQHGGRTLDDRDALPAHIFRQGGLGQVNLVVHVDQGHVGITASLKYTLMLPEPEPEAAMEVM